MICIKLDKKLNFSEIKKISLNSFINFDIENNCFIQGEIFFKQNKSIFLEKLCEYYKEVIDILNEEIKGKDIKLKYAHNRDYIKYAFYVDNRRYLNFVYFGLFYSNSKEIIIETYSKKLGNIQKCNIKNYLKLVYKNKFNDEKLLKKYLDELQNDYRNESLIYIKRYDYSNFLLKKNKIFLLPSLIKFISNKKKR